MEILTGAKPEVANIIFEFLDLVMIVSIYGHINFCAGLYALAVDNNEHGKHGRSFGLTKGFNHCVDLIFLTFTKFHICMKGVKGRNMQ